MDAFPENQASACSPRSAADAVISQDARCQDSEETKAERALVERARAGDHDAFASLCDAVSGKLFRQAVALCGHSASAEDLSQETLLAAWKGLRRFRGQCRFFTWLCAILIRLHYRSLRRHRPDSVSQSEIETSSERGILQHWAVSPEASPDRLLRLGELELVLRRCLARLPERQRRVVYLRFYVDSSLDGIARALGCSLGTVKSRLFHALRKLAAMPELNHFVLP